MTFLMALVPVTILFFLFLGFQRYFINKANRLTPEQEALLIKIATDKNNSSTKDSITSVDREKESYNMPLQK